MVKKISYKEKQSNTKMFRFFPCSRCGEALRGIDVELCQKCQEQDDADGLSSFLE